MPARKTLLRVVLTIAGGSRRRLPELFIRGAATYTAQLNAENPVGTIQSIEHALRSLEKAAEPERDRAARAENMLADYQEENRLNTRRGSRICWSARRR
jgi:hypothetical protein